LTQVWDQLKGMAARCFYL